MVRMIVAVSFVVAVSDVSEVDNGATIVDDGISPMAAPVVNGVLAK